MSRGTRYPSAFPQLAPPHFLRTNLFLLSCPHLCMGRPQPRRACIITAKRKPYLTEPGLSPNQPDQIKLLYDFSLTLDSVTGDGNGTQILYMR
ncbi:hypothetical protein GALMADRAFT_254125 [Galerina marginata CBS 339.88]|uniref:Uncharacterized protein n=1 Tax=Galerina marginata (strain CBS 339.88) TaxID=685588 RepID=A0A067SX38_GALM3|nr:hypothetical protein GALMADRAFT_254125 [Galerina marginata CBS 339.88]